MGEVHEKARVRRQKILALGPDLPTRPELAKILCVGLKIVTDDILILKGQGHGLKVKPVKRDMYMCAQAKGIIRTKYAAGVQLDVICTEHGIGRQKVYNVCRDLIRPAVPKRKDIAPVSGYTTRRKGFISTTYAASTMRAKQVQDAIHGKAVAS